MSEIVNSPVFFIDATPGRQQMQVPAGLGSDWELFGVYSRQTAVVVGLPPLVDEDEPRASGDRRCFNCGAPGHVVSDCPEPQDRQVINLSISLFDFHKNLKGSQHDVKNAPRIHDVAQWKAQRLHWVDFFVPGQVKGDLLREAMGNDGGDWLSNIARHGYPPGWTGGVDPREKMRERIVGNNTDEEEDGEEGSFLIVDEDEELVPIGPPSPIARSVSTLRSDSEEPENSPQRWASYPPSHFLSHLLPIYQRAVPEPVVPSSSASEYEEQQLWKQQLWENILFSFPSSTRLEVYYYWYFWFLYASQHQPPPEPKEEPPPLPPAPPSDAAVDDLGADEETDMDLSD